MTRRPHPKLLPLSEEMKAWAAALGEELGTWPGVGTRAMFGLTALYRGKQIFAVLPRTKGIGAANSLAFKLPKAGARVRARLSADSRISTTVMQATRWFVFEVSSDRDLNDALDWLGKAYDATR
jgi:hypothetical protein